MYKTKELNIAIAAMTPELRNVRRNEDNAYICTGVKYNMNRSTPVEDIASKGNMQMDRMAILYISGSYRPLSSKRRRRAINIVAGATISNE